MSETSALTVSQPRQSKPQNSISLFQPTSFNEAWEFAKVLADSGMVPKAYVSKPAAIISTWQLATELNVGLMQALQGVSNINGTPAVFGDLGWALVQNHPDFVDSIEDIQDTFAVCTLKRKGRTDVTRKYTLDMAKNAMLMGKDNWKNHPRRMLQWRARSWAMRDLFADALKGMVIYEEAIDNPSVDTPEPPKIQATVNVTKVSEKTAPAETPSNQPTPAESSLASDGLTKEETTQIATITIPQAKEYFRAYTAAGKLPEESKAFLKKMFNFEDSRMIPEDAYGYCMEEAKAGFPVMQQEENLDSEPA